MLSDPSTIPYNTSYPLIMYEDITSETFQADGEFWESISLPWDDYDDYLPKKELNTDSNMEYNQFNELPEEYDV